ncbi:chemotaxis protein CheE [Brevundimonas variabilis]|uniref:Proteasome lid subunit RPN8/RPN11 n=1 Tax=Brevundimonas variabilis TaxID=74312 RepID=A0A7W9FFT3_9CAUL|nr:chemotaxis protein CheE [Brevundimonas variabilis]MBB5747700.1 proteasome lid subunit RPN8/RPN11 [Brevundimonas variabilis]
MTTVKITRSKSSLSRKMARPGGRTVQEAIDMAEKGLESHREAGIAKMTSLLVQLEEATALRSAESQVAIYALAADLLDLAGFFETGPLYTATFSLCDIADRMQVDGTWDWPSVAVHVGAMRLIMSDGCQANKTSETVLQGLEAVRLRILTH